MFTKMSSYAGMFACVLSFCILSHADEVKVKADTSSPDQDTSILIHKGPSASTILIPTTHYQILEQREAIAGDPSASRETAQKNWKKACSDWKKELKENNGKMLISSSCGSPSLTRDSVTFESTQASDGVYKTKVAVSEPTSDQPN